MSNPRREGTKPAKRFPAAAVLGSALPLALVWVILYVTGAVDSGALIAIAAAIVVLVLFIWVSASIRLRRGR
ncbi:hypothetical protein ACWED2_08985 [Amycolatopsis sp. NPDC005003]